MIVEVPKVAPEGSPYAGEEDSAILELEKDRMVRVDSPIRYDFFVEIVSQELLVKGSLEVDVSYKCSKCADFFSTKLRDSSFLRAYAISDGTETVDVTEDVREAILLDLPSFPVCSPSCKGLCLQCGKNRNEGDCGCPPPADTRPWSALDRLDLS